MTSLLNFNVIATKISLLRRVSLSGFAEWGLCEETIINCIIIKS